MNASKWITVAETSLFQRKSTQLMSEEERAELISYVSNHPESGDLIQGSGGLRKLRWGTANRGKSGSVRIIYYFHSLEIPIWLLTLFAKNEKDDLSDAELKQLAQFVVQLKAALQKKKESRA